MASGGIARRTPSPLFSKYVLSGKTYVTANGAVIPNELLYYDGEIVHLYGECANVSAVRDALAGSDYKPLTLTHAGNRQTALAQIWWNRFTDTTIGPYSAMFIVVMAVPSNTPPDQASIRADANGASSVLAMLDGSFDPTTGIYENRARLFMLRLLDTTQVAIDVGRERMGTDKRPGTIDFVRSGQHIHVAIADQRGRGVVRAELDVRDDPAVYMPVVERAAATAGIRLRALPHGTEYVYPAVARIGRAPVLCWQWRSDVVPRLQPVVPGSVTFDSSSEEGRMLLTWGFTPKVLGYAPNVRGVITGLADAPPRESSPLDLATSSVPVLRAVLPGEALGVVSQLPVLRLVAQRYSPAAEAPTTVPAKAPRPDPSSVSRQPRWKWDTTFIGSLTAFLRKEVVGATPDGLRINWYVTTGSFVGPGLNATILPGAADWMRIRQDGIAIVSVQACFETTDGARVYGSYGGIFDLGPDGYARALRDEYDPLPPVVVTPTYATADPRLAWVNRGQFIGVGRVDMSALRVEFDVYAVHVGNRVERSVNDDGQSPRQNAGEH